MLKVSLKTYADAFTYVLLFLKIVSHLSRVATTVAPYMMRVIRKQNRWVCVLYCHAALFGRAVSFLCKNA